MVCWNGQIESVSGLLLFRCIGRTTKLTANDDPQGIREQDIRLIKKIQRHPSVLFVVAEGEDVQAGLISEANKMDIW